MSIEAMKLALDALEGPWDGCINCIEGKAITALRQALEQSTEQEPVAFEEWLSKQHGDPEEIGFLQALRISYISGQDSITHPPQPKEAAPRKPLTDDEIQLIANRFQANTNTGHSFYAIARAIEAAHGITGEQK